MADNLSTGLYSSMSCWSTIRNTSSLDMRDIGNEAFNWNQPFLPVEHFGGIQTGFGNSLPGLFESVDPLKDMNDSWANKFGSSEVSRVSSTSKQQLNFSNNTPFWNPSAISAPVNLPEPIFGNESSSSDLITVKSSERKRPTVSDQPASKKPRIPTPSPLPTFKVRKEKLGDRITALQQLVSPFGKTDTASVLQEAIDYIKFLHGQALSTPYLKNGIQQQKDSEKDEGLQDLRSLGLCLVPISSTFAVASESPMDFWAPSFFGSY
ncbi:transcription factor bHLH112-like isoform X2 [Asparagus officinalis]|uniref:transcription factor bHLH112-like isoform X2 n=1 Tax=Asparagus officinalis TaxID=4686 RepID=UPI00098E74CB|nr:transcription factor bHLH112-like isoform X2 [Asparagus officinalis]